MSSQNLLESETRSDQSFSKHEPPTFQLKTYPANNQFERISPQKWEELKPKIQYLYMDEDLSLDSVMKTLQESYGIIASKTQYKGQLKRWGFWKTISKAEKRYIVAKWRDRVLEGKETVFYAHHLLIPNGLIARWENEAASGSDEVFPAAATPEYVSYRTPSPDPAAASPPLEPVTSLNTLALEAEPIEQQQTQHLSPDTSIPGSPASEMEDDFSNIPMNMVGMGQNMNLGNMNFPFGMGTDSLSLDLCIDEPAKRLFSSNGYNNQRFQQGFAQFGLGRGQFNNNNELMMAYRKQQLMAMEEHTLFKCSVIGCEKAYKNGNDLEYHKKHGHPREHNLQHGIEPRVPPGLISSSFTTPKAHYPDTKYPYLPDHDGDYDSERDEGYSDYTSGAGGFFGLREAMGLEEVASATPVVGEEWEQKLKVALKDAGSIGTLEQTRRTFAKDDIAFTDSAYKSAPTLENVRDNRLVPEEPPPPPNDVDSPLGWGDTSGDDAKTSFSIGTDDPQQARHYILELCNDIHSRLHRCVNPDNRSAFLNLLPELLKALAIKLCHDAPTQENRIMMYFIYRQNKQIVAQLESMLAHDEEDEPRPSSRHIGDMSVLDKMRMWDQNVGHDIPILPCDDLFKGVNEDDEEDSSQEEELSKYHHLLVKSAAYKWFLTSLSNESVIQLESSHPRIRQQILEKLPTGKISKRRTPVIHEVSFNVEWRPTMNERLLCAYSEDMNGPNLPHDESLVITGSPNKSQALTMKQYITQTWSSNGSLVFDTLYTASTSANKYIHKILPDNTHLEAKIHDSCLMLTATGPAFFIATCGESLAWIGSSLLISDGDMGCCYTPSIARSWLEPENSNSSMSKRKRHCDIYFKILQSETSTDSLSGLQSLFLGRIAGFPIRQRPEGFPGVEVSFHTLLYSAKAERAIIYEDQISVKGKEKGWKLAKRKDYIFLWHMIQPLTDDCTCWTDCNGKGNANQTLFPLDHAELEVGRHILSNCSDDIDGVEVCNSKQHRLPRTESDQFYPTTRTNRGHNVGISLHNTMVPPNGSTAAKIKRHQQDETALRSSYISRDIYPTSIGTATQDSLRLSPFSEDLLSVGSQPVSMTGSPEYSLDSDMLSIPESAGPVRLLDNNERLYPFLRNLVHRLLSEFRNCTQSQSSHGDGSGAPSAFTSVIESPETGNSSRKAQKRKAQRQGDNDQDEDEEGNFHPPPKRVKTTSSKKLPRSFACPYLKRNPIKHKRCCEKMLSKIAYVKQHLTRRHTPERYCMICQATDFRDDTSLQRHMHLGKCLPRDPTTLNGISYQQHRQLTKKSKPNASEEDQWFSIWEILFGQHPKPSSVYIDTGFSLEMIQFREFSQIRLPALWREHVEPDPTSVTPDSTEAHSLGYFDRVIAECINTLFEEWRSNSAADSTTSEYQTRSMQYLEYETPAGSLVDSGVAVGSPAGGPRSQRSDLAPGFGTQQAQLESFPAAAVSYMITNPTEMPPGTTRPPRTQSQTTPSVSTAHVTEEDLLCGLEDQITGQEAGMVFSLETGTAPFNTWPSDENITGNLFDSLAFLPPDPDSGDQFWDFGDPNAGFETQPGTGLGTELSGEHGPVFPDFPPGTMVEGQDWNWENNINDGGRTGAYSGFEYDPSTAGY